MKMFLHSDSQLIHQLINQSITCLHAGVLCGTLQVCSSADDVFEPSSPSSQVSFPARNQAEVRSGHSGLHEMERDFTLGSAAEQTGSLIFRLYESTLALALAC